MKIKGIIHTEVEVTGYEVIKQMCEKLGLVNEQGDVIAKVEHNKVYTLYNDIYEGLSYEIKYYKPYDVMFCTKLLELYNMISTYMELSDKEKNLYNPSTGYKDYDVARVLKFSKK